MPLMHASEEIYLGNGDRHAFPYSNLISFEVAASNAVADKSYAWRDWR
jgi:hypothetical protein